MKLRKRMRAKSIKAQIQIIKHYLDRNFIMPSHKHIANEISTYQYLDYVYAKTRVIFFVFRGKASKKDLRYIFTYEDL